MKQRYAAVIVLGLVCGLTHADTQALEERSQGDVSFISGGIGAEERAALKIVRSDYNLRLLFSVRGTGEYISDVAVSIKDGKGQTVLDTVSEGPILLTKLSPGHYRVSASSEGRVVWKNVTVDRKHRAHLSLSWPG